MIGENRKRLSNIWGNFMPELPEMETYKTLLNERLSGKTITNVIINREKSVNLKLNDFITKVSRQTITSIQRRAKYLLFHLGNRDILLLHLMLGGWMYYGRGDERLDHSVQVQLSFGEYQLYFLGLRLGYLHYLSEEQVTEELEDLGPEPLDINFSLDSFLKRISRKRGKLKSALLDQTFLSGVGNRYSDEMAWYAQILPSRSVNSLQDKEKVKLYQSIQEVLKQAIHYGGYMGYPLFNGDTKTGGYLRHMYVYNREGEACYRCGSTIVKKEISSRKTFFCEQCQF